VIKMAKKKDKIKKIVIGKLINMAAEILKEILTK